MDTRHYTQTPSAMRVACDLADASVRVLGGGFVTRDMVGATLDHWRDGESAPAGLLIDLRDVSGYESGFAAIVAELLEGAHTCGVRRVAILASSSLLRTAASAIAVELGSDPSQGGECVACFGDERAAKRWLEAR
jgi:hypothetical protein